MRVNAFLILTQKTTPPQMVSWKFHEKNSCFKEHFRTATTDIISKQAKVKSLLKIRKWHHNQLNFDNHVSTLCKKAGSQLNAIHRLRKYIGFPEKKTFTEAFVFSNFNYFPLVWHFTSMRSTNKIESIQDRVLQLLYNDYTRTYHSLHIYIYR